MRLTPRACDIANTMGTTDYPKMRKKTGTTLLLFGALLLAACSSPAATAIPTPDLNPMRTEVAATVLAQVPAICALTPSATMEIPPTQPPTATIAPSATPELTATAVVLTTGTPDARDLAMWVSQTVQDDTIFAPGQEFNMVWQIKNVGTSTWTAAYRLRFYSGDPFGTAKEIALGKDVKPGETVEIGATMKAPAKPGDYRSDWVLSNEVLRNFKEPVFLKIKVAAPSATPTVAPATATSTPTNTPKP